jgi:hypothetical protein
MITPYVVALIWILSGGVAWRIATNRQGSSSLWVLLGQVFGPFSIPFAFMVRPKVK